MINEYELYSDEKYLKVQKYTVLGGLICTDTGRERLLMNLERVRRRHNKWGEMKWEKIKSTLDFEAYKDWANVFFEDPYARYVLFSIKSDMTFVNFYRQKRRKVSQEEGREAIKAAYKDAYKEGLSSAYHQFLLVSFGKLHDTNDGQCIQMMDCSVRKSLRRPKHISIVHTNFLNQAITFALWNLVSRRKTICFNSLTFF